jgi:c-di-GMP-binding flagellar brake protein YcgR
VPENSAAQHDTVDAAALLREACERNVPLELHHTDFADPLPAARSRLLNIDPVRLYIEQPQVIGRSVLIRAGVRFACYFELSDVLYRFVTTVVEVGRTVPLNASKTALGVVLARPKEIEPGERRDAERVALTGLRPLFADLCDPPLQPGDPPHTDGRAFQGRIVDLSPEGLCLIGAGEAMRLRIGERLWISFEVPGERTTFAGMVEVRHSRRIMQDTAVRIGLTFAPWPNPEELQLSLAPLRRFLDTLRRLRSSKAA